MLSCGSTSIVDRHGPQVVMKKPMIAIGATEPDRRVKNCFNVETQILRRLPPHPRLVKFLGTQGDAILLAEASHGDFQTYLDTNPLPSDEQRLEWCLQLAQAIDHVHSHGVIHSDLRPANILVHETRPGSVMDLQLSDFGGSVCDELGLDGLSLPDGPFCSPVFDNPEHKSSYALDIFGMGSIFYTIFTGRWPYKPDRGRFEDLDDRLRWEGEVVYPKFARDEFPADMHDLRVGDVIMRCWTRRFRSARDVLLALERIKKQEEEEEEEEGHREAGPGSSC